MASIESYGRYTVDFPGTDLGSQRALAIGVKVVQSAREHDAATIRMRSLTLDWYNKLRPGTPVTIKWSASSGDTARKAFIGYVSHVRPDESYSSSTEFDVFCIAASRCFREAGQEVWTNKTASQIVEDIARKHRFHAVVKPTKRLIPQVVQGGRTFWETMSSLAEQSGYGLRAEGTNLLFLPLSSLVDARFDSAPVLSTGTGPRPGRRDVPRTKVAHVEVLSGVVREEGDSFSNDNPVVTAINPVTGKVTQSVKTPKSAVKRSRNRTNPYTSYNGSVAYMANEADAMSEAISENGLMAIDAQADCAGNGALTPYSPVFVEGRNRATTGWFVVKSTVHNLEHKSGRYNCQVVLSTDTLGRSSIPPRSGPRKRNTAAERGGGFSPNSLKASRLHGRRWVAV